ncbi:MAG: type II secretion system protein [Gemmatimonadota bacterium]
MTRVASRGGFALVELLIVVMLIGMAGAAAVTVVNATAVRARRAGLEGRQASVVVRVASRARAGPAPMDSMTRHLSVLGQSFEATVVRRDNLLPGAMEIRVVAGQGRPALVLEAPRLAP